MKAYFALSLFAIAMANSPAVAEKAPLSVEELQIQSDLIVVATIEQIRAESEPSQFEPASGNSDWGIYLTLQVEAVERGQFADRRLEARCFRSRQRRSWVECLTPSGHHPIPAIGTRVRVYLEDRDRSWHVVLPNGIVPLDGDEVEAWEVTQLRASAFTYVLPIELWVLLILIVVPVVLYGIYSVRRERRQRMPD